jgi:hypothetical protein
VKPCGICGGFESVVGATPVELITKEPLGHGFFRTDLAFGSNQEKFPLILVGEVGAQLIRQRRWRVCSSRKLRRTDFHR